MRSSGWALLLVLVAAAMGCGSPAPEAAPRDRIAEASVRTDREPIERRFPGLGDFIEVHWLGGTLGDDRAPGPSTYFIRAAVLLAPADADALRARHRLVAAPEPVAVPGQLVPHLPGTGWVSGPTLDAEFALPEFSVRVVVRPDAPVAYVSATGGH